MFFCADSVFAFFSIDANFWTPTILYMFPGYFFAISSFFPLFFTFPRSFFENWSENYSFARVVLWDVLFFATSKNDQISAPRQVPIPSLGSFSSAWRDLYNGKHRCNVRRNFNGSTSSKSSIQMKCVLRVLRIFERFQGLRSLHYNALLTRA